MNPHSSSYSPETDLDPVEGLLTVAELSKALKVPVSWIYQHSRRRGRQRIPSVKLGKYLRFRWREVEDWLQSLREA